MLMGLSSYFLSEKIIKVDQVSREDKIPEDKLREDVLEEKLRDKILQIERVNTCK